MHQLSITSLLISFGLLWFGIKVEGAFLVFLFGLVSLGTMINFSTLRVTLTISERGMQLDTHSLFRRVRNRWRHDEFEGCDYTYNQAGLTLKANGGRFVCSALRSSVRLGKLSDVIEREHARYVGRGASAEASAEVEEPAFDRALERVPGRG